MKPKPNVYYKNLSFYLELYRILKQKAEGNTFISYSCVREVMNRRLHSFKHKASGFNFHNIWLKELESHHLIKRVGSKNGKNIWFELIGKDKDKLLN